MESCSRKKNEMKQTQKIHRIIQLMYEMTHTHTHSQKNNTSSSCYSVASSLVRFLYPRLMSDVQHTTLLIATINTHLYFHLLHSHFAGHTGVGVFTSIMLSAHFYMGIKGRHISSLKNSGTIQTQSLANPLLITFLRLAHFPRSEPCLSITTKTTNLGIKNT